MNWLSTSHRLTQAGPGCSPERSHEPQGVESAESSLRPEPSASLLSKSGDLPRFSRAWGTFTLIPLSRTPVNRSRGESEVEPMRGTGASRKR